MEKIDLTVWIIEDDQPTQQMFKGAILDALDIAGVQCRVRFIESKDGTNALDNGRRFSINAARDWSSNACDCIVLDLNLLGNVDIEGGVSVLSRVNELSDGCRNVCIATGHTDNLRGIRNWSEFERLLDENLRDRVALWQKDKFITLANGQQVMALAGHIVAIARAKAAGVRHSAAQIAYYRSLALSDDSVLLLGESGVGKEEVARAIHRSWVEHHPEPESVDNFVTINCAGLTTELIRAELFGVVKGAFTGAGNHTLGRILRAAGFRSSVSRREREQAEGRVEELQALLENMPREDAIDRMRSDRDSADDKGRIDSLAATSCELRDIIGSLIADRDTNLSYLKGGTKLPEGSQSFFDWLRAANRNIANWNADSLDVRVKLQGDPPRARGTVFLDEVHAMPLTAQRTLLRFLNDWEVTPVGYEGVIKPESTEGGRPRAPLVRVIAATNQPDWIALSQGKTKPTGLNLPESSSHTVEQLQPEWADVFYRLSRHILHIAKPDSSEIEHLIRIEQQESDMEDIEWDDAAKDELRLWYERGDIKGNRREIRAICRRAMQYVRGADYGIPVATPNRVSRRDLLLASPRHQGEFTPSLPLIKHIQTGDSHGAIQEPQVRPGTDPLLDFLVDPKSIESIASAFIHQFAELERNHRTVCFEDWAQCRPALFSSRVCALFPTSDSRKLWKLALLRAIIADDRAITSKKLFSDYPSVHGPDWIWVQVAYLVNVDEATKWLKDEKKKHSKTGPILPALRQILSSLAATDECAKSTDTAIAASVLAKQLYPNG
jgi:hypothetical protein